MMISRKSGILVGSRVVFAFNFWHAGHQQFWILDTSSTPPSFHDISAGSAAGDGFGDSGADVDIMADE